MDIRALDENVEQLYRLARAKRSDVWAPSRLAVAILGPCAVALVPGLPQLGRLVKGRIHVRAGLPPAIEEWAIGHELGHMIRTSTSCSAAEETACNYIGAAIQMRRAPFADRLRAIGSDYMQLAIDFGTTETSAALRVGEVTGRPVAVVMPQRIYARGALANMPENRVRKLADHEWPGVRKVLLTDALGRVAVDATGLLRST